MIRLVLRIVFFLVAAFGVLTGVIYPWAAANQEGYELGKWPVFSAGQGFAEIETILPPQEELVLARLEIGTTRVVRTGSDTVLVMTVTSGDWTVSAQGLTLEDAVHRDGLPTIPIQYYTVESYPFSAFGEEPYRFTFEHGSVELPLVRIELTLIGGIYEMDEVVPPIGWGLMAAGFLGFALTFRRRREKSPPSPRWGRG